MKKIIYTFLSLLCSAFSVEAQVTLANDNCSGAIALRQEANCIATQGSVLNATQSLAPCSPYSSIANDVWYSFVASSNSVSISVNNTSMDLAFEVLSGGCNALTAITCVDGELAGLEESVSFINLVAGQTYYVRVYENEDNALNSTFDICISDYIPPVPPANDDCASAIVLIPSLNPIAIAGSTLGATQTIAENACTTMEDYAADVWYFFVATDESATIHVEGQDYFDAIVEVFEGDCNALVSISCVDNTIVNASRPNQAESIVINTVIGETYFVRVYDYYGPFSEDFNFMISLESLDPINPCDTTNLVVSLDGCNGTQSVSNIIGGVAPYTYEWSNGETTPIANNLVVGEIYSVIVSDANGCAITMTFEQTICNTIDEVAAGFNIVVYPNPAKTIAFLFIETENTIDLEVELVNVMGQVIYSQVVANQSTMTYNLPLTNLPSGIYFIKVYSKEGITTKQLIIDK